MINSSCVDLNISESKAYSFFNIVCMLTVFVAVIICYDVICFFIRKIIGDKLKKLFNVYIPNIFAVLVIILSFVSLHWKLSNIFNDFFYDLYIKCGNVIHWVSIIGWIVFIVYAFVKITKAEF
jgi:hypothetical protein